MSAKPLSARPPALGGAPPPRILIVDDSVVARAMIARTIEASGRFVAVAAVANTAAALKFLETDEVDGILLDIEMPGVDGLTALPDLLAASGAKVLIVSSQCDHGGAATVRALALGAADTLVKPGIGAFAGRFADMLIDKLTLLLGAGGAVAAPADPVAGGGFDPAAGGGGFDPAAGGGGFDPAAGGGDFDIVAIGASTGGIHALGQLLREIPARFTPPILITQHLPESFMPYFAAQVAMLARRPCDVATDRMRIRPGRVIVAPGEAHLRIVSLGAGAAIRLSSEAVPNGCMPSVDPMFESLAEVYGKRALGVVLSGMGRDGSDGARAIAAAGGSVVVQDQASSVVWGMPGAIAGGGGAVAILPPAAIGRLIAERRRPEC